MKIPDVTTVDFETRPIEPRPDYPPKPVGFSIMRPGEKKSQYLSWGHPVRNNCTFRDAQRVLKEAWKSGPLLFHNQKFDVDVAETHMGCPRITDSLLMHDTMFLLALDNPHSLSLSLKPSAERILNMKPTERDDVARWLVEHQKQLKEEGLLPPDEKPITMSNSGKWICLAPGDLVGVYADGDVIRTYKLFRKLWPLINNRQMLEAYQREQRLMPILLDNERQGMRVNQRQLERDVVMYEDAILKADAWLRKKLRSPELNVDSDAELAEALDRNGIVTEWTLTKTGKRSTSKKNMKVDTFTDKNVASVLGYRGKLSTCVGTFMKPWLYTARRTGGIIHTNWNQVRQSHGEKNTGARTGRMSSTPNFQNIPTDLEDKNDGYVHPDSRVIQLPQLPLLRKLILPDSNDHWFGKRDYAGQELRITAHYENGALLKAYQDDPDLDIHAYVKEIIEEMLGHAVDRTSVKVLNFSYIYGAGVANMAERLGRPVAEIQQLRNAQMKALPGLKELSNATKERAGEGLPIRTWGGREYYCEEPKYSEKFKRVMSFEYKLLNVLVQGSAADVTKTALIRYSEMPKRESRFLVQVHDELGVSIPKKAFKEEMSRLKEAMESIEMDVFMKTDGSYGSSWGSLKKCL